MIGISSLWPTFLKKQDFNALENFGFLIRNQNGLISTDNLDFFISWGSPIHKIRNCSIETGFFKDALHIDSHGLYGEASFNFADARGIIESFNAPKTWKQLESEKKIHSKFGQPNSSDEWDGVVVACQHHQDRSVLKVGSPRNYHDFLDKICKYYGKKAFLKRHPVTLGNKEESARIEEIALKYDCEVAHVGSSILNKAEAVIVYNSTYAIDAMMKGKHIFQYAPGYFWQTGTVQYLNWKNPSSFKEINKEYINQFLSFLIWKYCFNINSPMENIAAIIGAFEKNDSLFPLPQELSYGSFLDAQ